MHLTSEATDGRRRKGAESRQTILRSAISCIAESGLSNTTLDRVAALAGVSRGLVVFHFKSKIKLLAEVLDYLGAQYGEGWRAIQSTDAPSAMEKLFWSLEYDVRFASENPEFISTWHAFWGEAKGNELYHELSAPRDQEYEEDSRRLLSLLIEEGDCEPDELAAIHTSLTALMFGLWLESHLNPDVDNYSNGMEAVRLFLSKTFPKHSLPPTPSPI